MQDMQSKKHLLVIVKSESKVARGERTFPDMLAAFPPALNVSFKTDTSPVHQSWWVSFPGQGEKEIKGQPGKIPETWLSW